MTSRDTPEAVEVAAAMQEWLAATDALDAALGGPTHDTPGAALAAALNAVMRNVVIGTWYDDPTNNPGRPAVARLHDAEAAMWRLYDVLGADPGDSYVRPALEAKP